MISKTKSSLKFLDFIAIEMLVDIADPYLVYFY